MIGEKRQRPQPLRNLVLFTGIFRGLAYTAMGIYLLITDSMQRLLSQEIVWVIGSACIIYGIFRGYRTIMDYKLFNKKEDEQEVAE
jgi:hypothetical protein